MVQSSTAKNNDKEIDRNQITQDEDELDDLDDLLDEFADDILSKQPGSTINTENKENDSTKKPTKDDSGSSDSKNNIDELIKDLNIEDPETKKQFEELVQQFSAENENEADSSSKNFDDVMKDTMSRLKNSGKDVDDQLKNGSTGDAEDMLSSLLSGLGGDGDLNMSNLLVDMLEQLSSKEVLYEPIKELNSKFPQYLEEKKDVISEEQHSNYSKQYDLTCEILAIFNASDYNDEDKAKKDNINSLLESLQELGQPPAELVGNTDDFLGLGGSGSGPDNLDFDDKDLPQDLEKQLEENCKQT